jgi:predicted TIM-barrel fold metal-dependent hydrolase
MCHECDDEGMEQEEFTLDMIPEEEREEFVEFASEQFRTVIEKASQHDILFELITEWSQAKQAMFTFTAVMENRMFNTDE